MNGRSRELDSLRGVWSILILVFHATQAPLFFGWSRVDFFFVLSGYFAARKLLMPSDRPSNLLEDLGRRSLRLMPAYYVLLFVVSVVVNARGGPSQPVELLAAVTLTQNLPLYWSSTPWSYCPGYLAHTWTLAVQLQFFLLLSIACRVVGASILAPLALALLVNCVLLRGEGLHPWTLLGRSDGLALGMLVALSLGRTGGPWRRSTRLGLAFAALAGLGFLGWFLAGSAEVPRAFDKPLTMKESLVVLATNLVYAGSVGLIVCHPNHPVLGFLRAGWLGRLGELSFGIYLYGFVAIELAEVVVVGILGLGPSWAVPLALALAILAAKASRAWIECPVIKEFEGGGSARPRTGRRDDSARPDVGQVAALDPGWGDHPG